MKVFGVGMIKTGTISFSVAMQRLGFGHLQGSYQTANRLLGPYLNSDWKAIYALVDKYDSFDDFPFCAPGAVAWLDKKYPDSKFVLTTRDPASWYNSIVKYFRLSETTDLLKASQKDDPKLPLGKYFGLVNYALKTFGTVDLYNNPEQVVKAYCNYNESVIDYFEDRPERLLRVCWMDGDGFPELCKFLNKPLLDAKFPHANKRGH